MAFEYNSDTKETGVDVTLEVPGGTEVPVTNVSYTEEAETSSVQFNTEYSKDIAVTGVSYSGSFEVTGRDNDLRDSVWKDNGDTAVPRYLSSISIIDGSGTAYTFSNVMITSHSKEAPADDRTNATYDFEAERLNVN